MRLAVLSDIHDNIWNLGAALEYLRGEGIDALLCCGDLCAPFIVDLLRDGLPGVPMHLVFGNNDGDRSAITRKAVESVRIAVHGELAELTVTSAGLVPTKNVAAGGLRMAMNHYDTIGRGLAASGKYDLVLFGHNHVASLERCGTCVAINPGSIMGYDGARRDDAPATFCVIDTERVGEPVWNEVRRDGGRLTAAAWGLPAPPT